MIQSGRSIDDLIGAIPQLMYRAGAETFKRAVPELAEMATKL